MKVATDLKVPRIVYHEVASDKKDWWKVRKLV
jgi:hypothetical protein